MRFPRLPTCLLAPLALCQPYPVMAFSIQGALSDLGRRGAEPAGAKSSSGSEAAAPSQITRDGSDLAPTGQDRAPTAAKDKAEAETEDARSIDEIYRQVFGQDRPAPAEDSYPVLIDGINVGTYRVRPDDAARDGAVEAKFVTSVLAPITIGDARSALEAAAGNTQVSFADLKGSGLIVSFDANALALRIDIPIDLRGIRTLNLRALRTRGDIVVAKQADISAYASARVGVALVEDSAMLGNGFNRFVGDFDFALNVHGLVLEGDLRYDDRRNHKLTRGDVRLTYDLLDNLIRFEAGDLSIGRRPFQSSPRIGGIAAFRNYGIDPYRNIRPVPDQLFELEESARVEVLVNGVPSRTFDLPSGRFSLRDFPLVPSAANDVELRITSASGEVRVVAFPAFYDLDLLADGLLEFAVNAGLPYTIEDGVRRYDDNNHNIIGFARYGVSNTLTAGANWESDDSFANAGLDLIWASPVGTFGINAATNLRNLGTASGRLTLQYRWRDTASERNRSVDALITLTGEDYQTLGQLFSGNLVSMQGRVRAGQNFGPRDSAQVFAGFERLRDDESGQTGDGWFIGGSYTKQFGFGAVSGGLEYRRRDGESDLVLSAAVSIPLGRGSINATASSESNLVRLDFNRFAASGVGAVGYRASVERRDGSDRQLLRANYTGNRFDASVTQRADNYFSNRDRRDLRTEFTFGTALVMANGHFGISRPVENAFAIVSPRSGASQFNIAVEPRTGFGSSETRYSAYSGSLGPAVVPQLSAYLNRALQVDAPKAPAGTSVGGQVFSVRPGYRAGYFLPVGDERNVSVMGILGDKDGDPVRYAVGEVTMVGSEDNPGKGIQVFTNKSGRFFVEGLISGKRYNVTVMTEGQSASQEIDVPQDLSGIFKLERKLILDLDVPSVTNEESDR